MTRFIFYTNYHSEKGKAMEINPNVCLSFFWNTLERQIIIKGTVEKLPENSRKITKYSWKFFKSLCKERHNTSILTPIAMRGTDIVWLGVFALLPTF